MALCRTCEQIFQGKRQRKLPPGRETAIEIFRAPTDEAATRGEHYASLAALKASAESGCHLCVIILGCRRFREIAVSADHDDEGPVWYEYVRPLDLEKNELGIVELHFHVGKMSSAGDSALALVPLKRLKYATTTFPVLPNTASEESWNISMRSFQTCMREHPKCRERGSRNGWNPSRLIDVGTTDSPTLNLHETSNSDGPLDYTTLSHCWGKLVIHRLLKKDVAASKASIDPSKLTRTFQDAIEITRRLRIRYLWIDSLCIIQDSSEDWKHESLLMGSVYQYGVCNIAATSGEDGRAGCFFDRNPLLVQPLIVKATWPGLTGLDGWGFSKYDSTRSTTRLSTHKLTGGDYLVDRGEWLDMVENGPLNQRAWVVQERLLAPRVMHFTCEQIYWECRTSRASEASPSGLPDAPSVKVVAPPPTTMVETGELQKAVNKLTSWLGERWEGFPDIPRKYLVYRQWDDVVISYTRCNLTVEKDKLVAISGLAEIFQSKTKDEYLAGLWRRVLPYQLLWQVINPHLTSRPEGYLAPSWSWAAVKGAVKDTFYHKQDDPDDGDIYINILDANVSSSNSDGLGEVTSGYIKLRGQLARAILKRPHDPQAESVLASNPGAQSIGDPELHLCLKDGETKLFDNSPTFDVISEVSNLSQVVCLLIRYRSLTELTSGGFTYNREARNDQDPYLKGLILVLTNTELREFRRVGVFGVVADANAIVEKRLFNKACKAFDEEEKGNGWDVEMVKKRCRYAITLV